MSKGKIKLNDYVSFKVPYFEDYLTYFGKVVNIEKFGLAELKVDSVDYNTGEHFIGKTFRYLSDLELTDNQIVIERIEELLNVETV